MIKIDILTLFPDMINSVLSESIIGRAREKGIVEINAINIRDYACNKHKRVDDYPYGGGKGMLMQAEPVYRAFKDITDKLEYKPKFIYMSPQGMPLDQQTVNKLAGEDHLIILCGHYEGIDERIFELTDCIEISIGDYVLTGGELPALVLCDSVCRIVPGVLKDSECYIKESHQNGLLEYPQYTRPEEFMGLRVPDVLLSGNHGEIDKWRNEQSILRTKRKRPDLYLKYREDNNAE